MDPQESAFYGDNALKDHKGQSMDVRDEGVGYISYEWEGAPVGVIDAYAGGEALLGIDEAVRFFNRQQNRGLASSSYEIPVYTGEGSWLAVVMGIVGVPVATFITAYTKKAAEKMAEKDFSDVGLSDVARKSMDALVRLVEVIKHLKRLPDWQATRVTWSSDASEAFIEDVDGDVIAVPAEYVKWYRQIPRGTLKRLSTPISAGGKMVVASKQENGSFHSVSVDHEYVYLLSDEDEATEDQFLFPELGHADEVALEGLVTRGNQSTNSIGLQFKGHILNCIPEAGNVRRYKAAMFLHCRVLAIVNRHVGSLTRLDNRPTLIIQQIIPLEDDNQAQRGLFE